MRILLSVRETINDPAGPVGSLSYAIERDWYVWLQDHQLLTVPNLSALHPYYGPDEYDCLLLTGGPDSFNRNRTENLLFAQAVTDEKPIIGICHGCFAINDLSGGKHHYIEDHHDTHHKIHMYDTIRLVNSYHKQAILSVGKNMEVVATDKHGNPEAIKHKEYPIYGMVWHPERQAPGTVVLMKEVEELLFPKK